ncbi:MAG: molybdopterin molybdotransferase MoeA [Verrucomicrobiota bacterium]
MSTQPLTSLVDALAVIRTLSEPLAEIKLPLTYALHSVLAQPVTAPEDIPPFSRSAMDGYALNEKKDTLTYSIQGEVHAGETHRTPLKAGQCIRIATGAPIPAGTNRVIPKELAQESGEDQSVTFDHLPEPRFIRHAAEDAHAGDTLLAARNPLTAGDLSLLATIGATSPVVFPLPVIAHLTTGDELVAPEETLGPGQIRDSNSILVRSFLQSHHLLLQHQSRSSDNSSDISQWIEEQSEESDVLLISGGASVGPRDFPPQLLQQAGFSCEFSRLNLRPGKPVFFGKRKDTYAFVLPGNPGSHLTVLRLLVLPLLQILCSRKNAIPRIQAQVENSQTYSPNSRHTFLPGRLERMENEYHVSLNTWRSSGDVVSLSRANCLVEIPSDTELSSPANCIPLFGDSLI